MVQRASPFPRLLSITLIPNPIHGSAAAFLWGPRQTGKTTLLRMQHPEAEYFDLLDTELAAELAVRPRTFRERALALAPERLIVVDEVQKVPEILDEAHWLLENTGHRLILCGSSARKLKRQARNLLGGRAVDLVLHPLTVHEIPDFDLDRALNHGTLPAHYLLDDPTALLASYANNYIKEEIIDESLTRSVPAFARFLQIVALTHGKQLNYANVSRECGVSASTVRAYYQILKDTLLGFELEPWRKSAKRRMVETVKFFLFDIGLVNALSPECSRVVEGTDIFGQRFEHLILNEVRAYRHYRQRHVPLHYWRTSSGLEVDLIVGPMTLAVEIKSAKRLPTNALNGIRALMEEHRPQRKLVVCREPRRRTTEDGIEVLPWREFCAALWDGRLF